MELPNSTDLSESLFFTARKARLRSHTQESMGAASSSDPGSSSSQYYSARIHTMMEHMSNSDVTQEDAEIEASRAHWTEVEPEYFTAATSVGVDSSTSESGSCVEVLTEAERLRLYEENVEAIRSLQRDNPENRFFQIGDGGVVLGRKIAEGAQGEIYEGGSQYATAEWNDWGEGIPVVLKVFKGDYSLRDLQRQWPLALLQKITPLNADYEVVAFSPVLCGRLLGDGRFAFEMGKFWGDLRKFLDVRMQLNGNRHPPFMMPDGNYHDCCMLAIMDTIALGMRGLHKHATLHRDLKASNVLIESARIIDTLNEEDRLNPMKLDHNFGCLVTDYECSIGVMGTGYWRAPEILEAVKTRTLQTTANVFTPKSDVYSYAMTCYEIFTGFIPFEDIEDKGRTSIDDVLQGRRPKLPSHLRPWMRDLFGKCWHADPLKRPTFEEIQHIFKDIVNKDPSC